MPIETGSVKPRVAEGVSVTITGYGYDARWAGAERTSASAAVAEPALVAAADG